MNFTREIKRELIRKVPTAREEKLALLCGALSSCGELIGSEEAPVGFCFSGESEETAEYLLGLVEALFGVEMMLSSVSRGMRQGRSTLTFSYTGENGGAYASEIFSFSEENGMRYAESFLKGAFLGGGSCTLPKEGKKTGYHLEVVFAGERQAEEYRAFLDIAQLSGTVLKRGGRYVVYTKSREAIADFLAALNAEGALKVLEDVASAREESNLENRKENCYAQNADKAAIASAKQTLLLTKLKDAGKFPLLSKELLSAANARLENPELSLSELAQKLGLSKSCLNHRLRKLMQICRAQENMQESE